MIGTSKRSDKELKGRTDSNKKVLIPRQEELPFFNEDGLLEGVRKLQNGDYVVVELTSTTGIFDLTLMLFFLLNFIYFYSFFRRYV